MIRKELALKEVFVPSLYILSGTEIDSFLSRCNSRYKDIAEKELIEGAQLIQVFHPYFLTASSSEIKDNIFLNSCVSEVLSHHFPSAFYSGDYWIISYPLIPEDPVVYVILKNCSENSNITFLQKDT